MFYWIRYKKGEQVEEEIWQYATGDVVEMFKSVMIHLSQGWYIDRMDLRNKNDNIDD